jgi:type IV secretory pathway VirB9-like protein
LHVCSVALQDGEAVTSVSIGDTVRWLLQNATAGSKPVMMIKPTQAGLSTNLVVTTDKGRVYYMHLVSSKTEYVPMVSLV